VQAGAVDGSWDDMIHGMVGGIRSELTMIELCSRHFLVRYDHWEGPSCSVGADNDSAQ
jgi:hypothetical protein